MPVVNGVSLREEVEAAKARAPRVARKARRPEKSAPWSMSCSRFRISRSPSCRTGRSARPAAMPASRRRGGKGRARQAAGRRRAAPRENGGIRKVVREEAETDDACDACGADLSGIGPFGRERRVQAGIVFEIVGSSVEAWTKERPGCGSRTIVSLRIGNDVNPLV